MSRAAEVATAASKKRKPRVVRERDIEEYLCKEVAKLGGKCYKWVSPGNPGVCDRIALFPHGILAFIETKSPTGRLRASQKIFIRELAAIGHNAHVVKSKGEVDKLTADVEAILKELRGGG